MLLNTFSMKIRALANFKKFEDIINDKNLDLLINVNIPNNVKCAILSAFYEIYLSKLEQENKFDELIQTYKKLGLNDKLSGLIDKDVLKENIIFARMLCYEMGVQIKILHTHIC